ncbi:hillarin-like [Pomacea canaliculata]|uniref:hillarin-like n=1 Tax=Pomacea canaliculata TaxID=400727 RepID=UPI000D73FADD|nr:hillarin-like [Pomacea canaliculata]
MCGCHTSALCQYTDQEVQKSVTTPVSHHPSKSEVDQRHHALDNCSALFGTNNIVSALCQYADQEVQKSVTTSVGHHPSKSEVDQRHHALDNCSALFGTNNIVRMSRKFCPVPNYDKDDRVQQIKELSKSVRKLTYPPPAPPVNKNWGKEDFSVIDNCERKLVLATTEDQHSISFDDLVSLLTKDLTTEVQKVRALYMWISWQNLTEASSYTRDHPVSLPYGYLKYAVEKRKYLWEFFAHLCRLAGLPCVVIRGMTKLTGWKDSSSSRSPDSTWNAVYVDGSWQLVHIVKSFLSESTGGTTRALMKVGKIAKQSVRAEGININRLHEYFEIPSYKLSLIFLLLYEKTYSEPFYTSIFDDFYFLPDPAHFIHFFMAEEFWLALSEKLNFITKAPNGRCAIWFQDVPRDEELNKYFLYFDPESSDTPISDELLTNSCVVVNASPKLLFTRLPVAGWYQLYINNKNGSPLLFLHIVCSGPIKKQPFPFAPKGGFGFGNEAQSAGLSDPLLQDGVIKVREGEKTRFKFRKPTSKEVRIRPVHHDRGSDDFISRVTHEQSGDHVTVSVRVLYDDHNPEYGLQIDTCEGDSDSENALNYLLTPDQQLSGILKTKKSQARDDLKMAIADDDTEVLENALSEYRAFGDDGKSRQPRDNSE